MQCLLDKCTEYASDHDIQFNTDKSVCMLIKSKKVVFHKNPVLLLNNRVLSFVDQYKYLGCILTSNRSDVSYYNVPDLFLSGKFVSLSPRAPLPHSSPQFTEG